MIKTITDITELELVSGGMKKRQTVRKRRRGLSGTAIGDIADVTIRRRKSNDGVTTLSVKSTASSGPG